MTEETKANQPKLTLRDRAIKATIWENPSQDGTHVRYSVEFIRSYTDEQNNWHDTRYFSGSELLRVARLAEQAYDRIGEFRTADQTEQ